jgi:hypothetical protein
MKLTKKNFKLKKIRASKKKYKLKKIRESKKRYKTKDKKNISKKYKKKKRLTGGSNQLQEKCDLIHNYSLKHQLNKDKDKPNFTIIEIKKFLESSKVDDKIMVIKNDATFNYNLKQKEPLELVNLFKQTDTINESSDPEHIQDIQDIQILTKFIYDFTKNISYYGEDLNKQDLKSCLINKLKEIKNSLIKDYKFNINDKSYNINSIPIVNDNYMLIDNNNNIIIYSPENNQITIKNEVINVEKIIIEKK